MSRKGSVKAFYETLTRDYAKKMVEYEDSAMFAFVIGAFQAITARGYDPEDFELLFIEGEIAGDDTTFKIEKRVRVRRFQ